MFGVLLHTFGQTNHVSTPNLERLKTLNSSKLRKLRLNAFLGLYYSTYTGIVFVITVLVTVHAFKE